MVGLFPDIPPLFNASSSPLNQETILNEPCISFSLYTASMAMEMEPEASQQPYRGRKRPQKVVLSDDEEEDDDGRSNSNSSNRGRKRRSMNNEEEGEEDDLDGLSSGDGERRRKSSVKDKGKQKADGHFNGHTNGHRSGSDEEEDEQDEEEVARPRGQVGFRPEYQRHSDG